MIDYFISLNQATVLSQTAMGTLPPVIEITNQNERCTHRYVSLDGVDYSCHLVSAFRFQQAKMDTQQMHAVLTLTMQDAPLEKNCVA